MNRTLHRKGLSALYALSSTISAVQNIRCERVYLFASPCVRVSACVCVCVCVCVCLCGDVRQALYHLSRFDCDKYSAETEAVISSPLPKTASLSHGTR
jgi:hypothetical protein